MYFHALAHSRTHTHSLAHTHTHSHAQTLIDRLVASEVLTAYERDYELDKLMWFYDEMGGGVEGKRKKVFGKAPTPGQHYRPCVVTTGDMQDAFHTSMGIFANNHVMDKPFIVQRCVLRYVRTSPMYVSHLCEHVLIVALPPSMPITQRTSRMTGVVVPTPKDL